MAGLLLLRLPQLIWHHVEFEERVAPEIASIGNTYLQMNQNTLVSLPMALLSSLLVDMT